MAFYLTLDQTGQIAQGIRLGKMISTDSYATITAAGYFDNANLNPNTVAPTDYIFTAYGLTSIANGLPSGAPTGFAIFNPSISNGVITLVPSTLFPSSLAGQTITDTTSSATPGTIRSLTGKITGSATTMTSGNLVGLRGEADVVGASGGFIYGAQGKVIPTGTFTGSVWVAGVFAQFDLSHPAVINGAQFASIWGDWGATGATATDLTGCRGIAFTNTTSNVLNAQDYRYGNATYLLELAGAGGTLNYYAAAGTGSGSAGNSTHCAAQQVIKIDINGSAAYIPVFTQNT